MLLGFVGNFASNQLPPSVHLLKGSLDFWRTIKVRTTWTLVYFLCIISNICSVTGSQRTTCMSATYAARSEPSLKDPWVTRTLRLLYLAASGDWEKYMLLQELIFYCRTVILCLCVGTALCNKATMWAQNVCLCSVTINNELETSLEIMVIYKI